MAPPVSKTRRRNSTRRRATKSSSSSNSNGRSNLQQEPVDSNEDVAAANDATTAAKAGIVVLNDEDDMDDNNSSEGEAEPPSPQQQQEQPRRSVAASVRERQRRVAEREASRLARPEVRPARNLMGHANRQKAAVTSTPFGNFFSPSSSKHGEEDKKENNEEWCGPFSVARQMIAQREEARRKREEEQAEAANQPNHPLDEMMEDIQNERKRKAHPSLTWKSQVTAVSTKTNGSTSLYAKRKKRMEVSRSSGDCANTKIPTLFQLCVNYVVQNFDHVESLGDVGSSIRNAIASELVAQHKLDGIALEALVEDGMDTLELQDASNIAQEQLCSVLQRLLPTGLQYLSLHHAGRCFGQKSVQAILSSSSSTNKNHSCCNLMALSIGGAYLFKDDDAASLIRALAPTLSSLEFTACPFLGSAFCQSLADSYDRNNNNHQVPHSSKPMLVELSLDFLPLSSTQLSMLFASSSCKTNVVGGAWHNLKTLSLKRMESLTDAHVGQFLEQAGETLEHLDLSFNVLLTDDILSNIRRYNPNLKSLLLCGLVSLTSAGLETYFTMDIDGFPHAPPMLRTLKLALCDSEAVTDDVLEKAAVASSRKLGNSSYGTSSSNNKFHDIHNNNDDENDPLSSSKTRRAAVVSSLGGLMDVDIRGSRKITDTALEVLAATSSNSLKSLHVSFCPFVTDKGLGYLVSQIGPQLKRIEIWGCCQITEEFLDGHGRVQDGSLEIVGAWMKKSGTSSLRYCGT